MHSILDAFSWQSLAAAFGLIWTVLAGINFFAFVSDNSGEPLLWVLFVAAFLVGLGMMAPWMVRRFNRPTWLVSAPSVSVTGPAPRPGSRLKVDFRQRNSSVQTLYTTFVRLSLVQFKANTTKKGGEKQKATKAADENAGRWMRAWAHDERFPGGNVPPGDTIHLTCEFEIDRDVKLEPLDNEWWPTNQWWGIEVETSAKGETCYSETFWLPPVGGRGGQDSLSYRLVIPGTLMGLMWGFCGMFTLSVILVHLLFGAENVNWALPLIGLPAAVAGLVYGGKWGYAASRRIARWPFVRPFAELWGRIHWLIQFSISPFLAFFGMVGFVVGLTFLIRWVRTLLGMPIDE